MAKNTSLSDNLVKAYQETHYQVYTQPPITLLIDQPNTGLAGLYQQHAVQSAAFITACNPASQQTEPEKNQQLQQQLADKLAAQGYPFIDGIGQDPKHQWPGEPSFLVLGITQKEAEALGRQFGQNAIVWVGEDTCPRLLLSI